MKNNHAPLLIGAGILAFLLLGAPAMAAVTPFSYLRARGLTNAQSAMELLILREFKAAGLPSAFAYAAVVNAKRESNLNPDAFNPELAASSPGRGSVGLFQLYDNGKGIGAGAGMSHPLVGGLPQSSNPRLDPTKNTRRIIQEVQNRVYGRAMRDEFADGATVGRLAALFTRDIERPAGAAAQMNKSVQIARSLYPSIADEAGSSV